MIDVELIYDRDCPNVAAARAQLVRAFVAAKLTPRRRESSIEDAPPLPRRRGSPTVLVGGRDVVEAAPGDAATCRVYPTDTGALERVPPVEHIVAALAAAVRDDRSAPAPPAPPRRKAWYSSLAVLPGIGAALLPKVTCPACWPVYAGFLGSAGLGFLLDVAWLLPLTAASLVVAVGALAFRARRRRGYRPFLLGLAGAGIVLVGKFAFESDPAMFAGLAVLLAASVWNGWPRRHVPSCGACASASRIR